MRWQRSVPMGASSDGRSSRYAGAASRLGRALAERDATVVYGGALTGLMYHAAAAARERGGSVIGVIPLAVLCRRLG